MRYLLACLLPFCALHPTESKICLTVVVENDSETLGDCLESAKDFADAVCICDTGHGSSVGVIECAQKFTSKHSIPLFIEAIPKTEELYSCAVQRTQCALRDCGFYLDETFLLVVRPDMKVDVRPDCKKSLGSKDAYQVLHTCPALGYSTYDLHLLRASVPWESKGEAPSDWTASQPIHIGKLAQVRIEGGDSHLDRMCKALESAHQKTPDSRWQLLQLAQVYKTLQNYEKAIETYKMAIQKGGFGEEAKEEIWFATFMIGSCYEASNQWHHALFWYLDAYQRHLDRPDPLYKIATHYRSLGQNNLAHLFAQYGIRIPPQENEHIFALPPLRDYQFAEELSIAAYYTRFRDDGYEAVSDLMICRDVPWDIKLQAGRNLLFYIQNLKNTRFHPITIDLSSINREYGTPYAPTNSSIIPTENGYLMIVRTVNYRQTDGCKNWQILDSDGVFRSKNFLLTLDSHFNVLSQREVIEELEREKFFHRNEGFDDCRLFSWNGSLYCTCTTNDTNPTHKCQISLFRLDTSKNSFVQVDRLIPLHGPDPNRDEKNWLPFIYNGALRTVYSCDPFTLYEPNLLTGECPTVFSKSFNCDFSQFRGSAPPIAFDDGYLMLIHEAVLTLDWARCYTHRFIYLDANMNITRVSKPFVFQHQGVEFCCGMCFDPQGKELIMSIGIEEWEVAICTVDVKTVRSSLRGIQ